MACSQRNSAQLIEKQTSNSLNWTYITTTIRNWFFHREQLHKCSIFSWLWIPYATRISIFWFQNWLTILMPRPFNCFWTYDLPMLWFDFGFLKARFWFSCLALLRCVSNCTCQHCLLKPENVCKLENACLSYSVCAQPETEQSNMLIALTDDNKKADQASLLWFL